MMAADTGWTEGLNFSLFILDFNVEFCWWDDIQITFYLKQNTNY